MIMIVYSIPPPPRARPNRMPPNRDHVHPPSLRTAFPSYLAARTSLRTATSIDAYLKALNGLRAASKASVANPLSAGGGGIWEDDRRNDEGERPLGVPIKWVKQQLPGVERAYQVLCTSSCVWLCACSAWDGCREC